jgi:hypothetical protein
MLLTRGHRLWRRSHHDADLPPRAPRSPSACVPYAPAGTTHSVHLGGCRVCQVFSVKVQALFPHLKTRPWPPSSGSHAAGGRADAGGDGGQPRGAACRGGMEAVAEPPTAVLPDRAPCTAPREAVPARVPGYGLVGESGRCSTL